VPILVAGRLRILDPLGEGGTGTVHRAWDLRTRRYVAAKLVPAHAAGWPSPGGEGSLSLGHPHVLTPDEIIRTPDLVVLLMPLVRGGTAERLLAEHGGLPADFVAVLLDQLLDALDAVHRGGLVHGDVKPANLLLDATGSGRPHLRLGDFGAACAAGSRARAATAGYLAPEVAAGAALDPRQDLFAAGATAAELMAGRPPGSAQEIPHGPLRPLLRDLLAADPRERPPDAETARARLGALGVPHGDPWQRRPHPPHVPDRLCAP
jgi:eukaryotic-like serine/threonine-protein kinase